MLTLADIPEWLENANEEARSLAQRLAEKFSTIGQAQSLAAGVNAAPMLEGQVAYVTSGMIRYTSDGKLIRFFAEDDVIGDLVPDCSLELEFATELLVCDRRELQHAALSDPRFGRNWLEYRELQLKITFGLCEAHIAPQKRFRNELRYFRSGDVIIRQGDPSKEIYVLISGGAQVLHDDAVVGEIEPNEIFGEMSYLIGAPRAATVVASEECMVQVVRGEDFKDLMAAKPNIALQLAATQARRIAGLNSLVRDQDEEDDIAVGE